MNKRFLLALLCVFSIIRSNVAVATPIDTLLKSGPDYYAILPNKILLVGKLDKLANADKLQVKWTKIQGPGSVSFEKQNAEITWATVSTPGNYLFQVEASGKTLSRDSVCINVYAAGPYFGNPMIPGMFPDPHIMYDGGLFYLYATSMENANGAYGRSSVWVSKDFVNWDMTLTNWPVFGKFNGDIWAPDILRKGDTYYQFITRSGGYDTWIGVADSPIGPWKNLREDNTPIVSGGGKAGRIVPAYNMDSQPFIDDDGQAYMYWGWSESMAAKLTPDLKNIDGDVHFLKGTKWLPDGGKLPQWLSIDLGFSTSITKTITCPEFRDVRYSYLIETSEDNSTWKLLVDKTINNQIAGEGYVDNVNGFGRYVRISFLNCEGNWAGLYDFSVFSDEKNVSLNKSVLASSFRGPGSEPKNAVDVSNGPQIDDFVEGSYMIKRNDIYYLLYSSGRLHDGSYSVHYAMSKSPFGPFTKPNPNIVLQMNAEKTTKGPGHNSILKFQDKYYIVYHQHNQPHEDAGGVFRQACADVMEFNADNTIKEVTPTQTGVGALQPLVAQGNNIAFGKYAKATSVRSVNYVAEYALDQNYASKWQAADNQYPQSLTIDLKGKKKISRIETSFEYATLSYKYRIETSMDGKNWQLYVDKTSEFPTTVSPQKDLKNAKAAYVRITVTGCQRPENGAGIYEFKVFS